MDPTKIHFDVVIVGGGPAGSATALSLLNRDSGLKVALLEKTALEKKRVGEILKPAAQSLLEQLGVWQAFRDARYPLAGHCRVIWGADEPLDREFIPETDDRGWEIDRRAFDSLLFEQAGQRGVHTFTNHDLVDYQKSSDHEWQLSVQNSEKKSIELTTSFLVDATGQSPFIGPKQGARKVRLDRLVGLYVIFNNKGNPSRDASVLAETGPHGWWYSLLLPGDFILAALMTDNDLVGRLELIKSKKWWELLKESKFTYPRVESCTPVSDFNMRLSDSFYLEPVQGEGWASVGDATARLDPLSGHGLYWAMQSGIEASDSIIHWLKGDWNALMGYQQKMNREYRNYLVERRCVYSLEKRWAQNPFWQRRQDAAHMDPALKAILNDSEPEASSPDQFHFFHSFQDKISH